MTDKPATTRKSSGALIVLGVLVAAGFVLAILGTSRTEPTAGGDAGYDAEAEVLQVFDLEEDPRFKAGIPLRPMDRDILTALKAKNLTREQMQDLFPDRPYRVRVMGNVSDHKYALVTVDLARDGKLEERWDLRKPPVTRTVPQDPNAPDNGAVKYTLSHGRWQLH